jgi:DNA-binding Lrp family transcriptional regulator
MELNAEDLRLLEALQDGLPLDPRPYAALGARLGRSEADVITAIERLIGNGTIRRFGIIVRHHELGYCANAMVVWDVPDSEVATAGRQLAALPFVTLSYRRPRRLPDWPYNLFAMIHGRDRAAVEGLIVQATKAAALEDVPSATLFSRRRFKQRGARYVATESTQIEAAP